MQTLSPGALGVKCQIRLGRSGLWAIIRLELLNMSFPAGLSECSGVWYGEPATLLMAPHLASSLGTGLWELGDRDAGFS